MAKNGLPPSSRAPAARAARRARGSQRSASAMSCPTCSRASGASVISAHLAAGGPDGVELAHQRMGGGDFVVAIGADQHEVLQIRPGQQILQQIERRRVEPLQVVEEERQRMLRPGEHADEPPKHQLETPLRVLRRKLRDRRLVSDDELQLGDEVDHEPAVRAQRLQQGVAPAAQLGCRSCRAAAGRGSERPAPASHTGCRACTGRTCPRRTGRAAAPAPCAVH